VVSGDEDGVVRLWKVQTRRLVRKCDLTEVAGKMVETEGDGLNFICCVMYAKTTLNLLTLPFYEFRNLKKKTPSNQRNPSPQLNGVPTDIITAILLALIIVL